VIKANGLTWSYVYDNRNEMVAVLLGGVPQVTYKYDALGHRIEENMQAFAPGTLTHFAFDGDNVVAELDGNNNNQPRLLYLQGDETDQHFARQDASNGVLYYLTDRQGSVINIIMPNGGAEARSRYQGFQIVIAGSGWSQDRYRYAGREYDPLTGLEFNRGRYFDPLSGRWVNQDPAGFTAGDTNLYRYVGNDPTNATDPSGLVPDWLKAVALGTEVIGKDALLKATEDTLSFTVHGIAGFTEVVSPVPINPPMPQDNAGMFGRAVGRSGGLVFSLGEILFGSGEIVGGVGISLSGIGAVVGVPAVVKGGVIAAHGVNGVVRFVQVNVKNPIVLHMAAGGVGPGGGGAAKPTAAERLAARREALRQQELADAVKQAEAKGRLNDLDAADQGWLNADPTGQRKALAFDPDTGSFKPDEARAALRAEGEKSIPGPVRRDFELGGRSSGGDIVDGSGKVWDVKKAEAGADHIVGVAAPRKGKGENVLVDAANLNPAQRAALKKEIDSKVKAGSGDIVITPPPP
jgi:RHS repeat-associated protein